MRHDGLLGNRHRVEHLARGRALLGTTVAPSDRPRDPPLDYRDRAEALTGVSLRAGPVCADGHMIVTRSWLRGRSSPVRPDTS